MWRYLSFVLFVFILSGCSDPSVVPTSTATPAAVSQRGQGRQLTIFSWQAASHQMPYLAAGGKELAVAAMVLEPLARYDPNGNLIPVLASELPDLDNGGISSDLRSITWTLLEDLLWSDGTPVTSADVVFSYEFCVHPEATCAATSQFDGVESVDAVDDLTVTVTFTEPTPFPYKSFVTITSPIIQKAQWEECLGAAAIQCTEASFMPIGTGPYVATEFIPNDSALYEFNPHYRDANKPFFASIFVKGGGDAEAAARAVLVTGEADFAGNLQLNPEMLADMESEGLGQLQLANSTAVELIIFNFTNPSSDLATEERSEYLDGTNPHPFLRELTIRQAMSMAIDRDLLTELGYGDSGQATCNLIPGPEAFLSTSNRCDQDLEGANKLMDEAGIVDTDGDGIREFEGKPLAIMYQTATNRVRQDYQILIKQWWSEIGIETELRNIEPSVFFGGDVASPDTYTKFYADVEMFTTGAWGLDFEPYLANFACENISSIDNNWLGSNVTRYCSPQYDSFLEQLGTAPEIKVRRELIKAMNDHLVQNFVIIPLTNRGAVSANSHDIEIGAINAWDSVLWNIADWTLASE